MKVMTIFGTRPEAIKMAPVVKELLKHKEIETKVCLTAQHREMLELDDLGPVTNARIRRDLALSAKVIAEFGVPVDRGTAEIQSFESNRI